MDEILLPVSTLENNGSHHPNFRLGLASSCAAVCSGRRFRLSLPGADIVSHTQQHHSQPGARRREVVCATAPAAPLPPLDAPPAAAAAATGWRHDWQLCCCCGSAVPATGTLERMCHPRSCLAVRTDHRHSAVPPCAVVAVCVVSRREQSSGGTAPCEYASKSVQLGRSGR